ncbi:MAG: transglutaminase-like domain-containing protein [Oscillospiraceae bacterium]
MKQKNLTGLRAGIYRETQSTRGQTLLELLSALLIFLALAAIFHTVSGFSAMLWLLGAGILTCTAAAIIRHFQKTKLLFPILLAALLLVVLFARNPLLNGLGAAWNTLRDLWAAEKGILLPLAETDGTSLWLAGIVAGILLAMVSVALSRVPTLTAVLLAALSVAAAFVQPDILLLFAAGISILLLSWQKHKNAVSAASFLLVGVIVAGVAAIFLQTGTMQALSQNAKDTLHHWRYEKVEEVLPEGDLSEPVVKTESTDTILSVTADTAQTLYLRGFVGDIYENEVWSALDAQTAAEEKDLFYWLHQSGFYPQSQLASAARLMGNYQSGSVSVQNLTGCSLYCYEPCTILPERAGLAKNRIQPSAVETIGLRGERRYSYETVSDAQTLLPELLDFLQNDTSDGVKSYLQMESAYREFVYSYALDVPAEFRAQLGAVLDQCCESYGPADSLTKEQAQTAALAFLELCFDGSDTIALPLADTADGTTYQYATVAALALRYYGIPARYVEGYTIKTTENEPTSVDASAAGAWVEVYQDGIGWLPLALTPGLENLSAEQTESGIKPVGAGKEGNGDGPRITEGQELEQDDAEPDDSEDNTPDGGQRTGLLHKPVFWIILVAALLLLLLAAILIRHAVILKKRNEAFMQEDPSAAAACLFTDCASLLAAMGLKRGTGSMLELCETAKEQLGEDYAAKLHDMTMYNAQALFSSRAISPEQLAEMRTFHDTTLENLKTHTNWPKKLRLKWLNCLY